MIPWNATDLDIATDGELRLLLHGVVAATAHRRDDGRIHVATAPDAPEWASDLVEEALREGLRQLAHVD